MKTMKPALIAAIMTIMTAANANAAVIVNFSQVGADVVVTGSGTFDTSGLTKLSPNIPGSAYSRKLEGGAGILTLGDQSANGDVYNRLSGPSSFGKAGFSALPTLTIGQTIGLNSSNFFLPGNYKSGSEILGAQVYAGQSLASLGLTDGTSFVYRSSSDSLTINIGQTVTAAVPEPATWGMMILGMGAIGFIMRRRNVTTRVKFA